MSSDASAPVPIPPTSEPTPFAGSPLWRWVCTSNPFYVISAALFLVGLRVSFGAQARDIDSWALTGGLAGYTLLLAAAALLLVRFAGVWNDVRTVLLLVVLMFLATSVTFDELLVLDSARGRWFCVGGLAFAVALTELLLRGIGLRFPLLFRLPYHLALALFFLYPLALVPLLRDPHSESLLWGLWGFGPAAGLVFLTLLPAVRRGREYTRDNGSPWWWPYYPWSVFVFLAFAVCGRAFLLCWSFHLLPSPDHLVFGPYFLAPFGLALAVLLLELGIVERSRVTQTIALVVPIGLTLISGIGHRADSIYAEFLDHFATRFGGTPLFVALGAAGAFYLYAWARRVPLAAEFLTAAVAALAVVRPVTLELTGATAPHAGPLVAAVVLQAWVWVWRREWWRMALGAAVVVAWGGAFGCRAYLKLREEVAGLDYLALSLVLLPIAVLISLARGGALDRWRERPPTPTG
ncbi:MAG: hypothetical protein J0I06_13965 [Planctomycetes bacterium]|nr:hypothetical protein [Planctomycetota bacterium]